MFNQGRFYESPYFIETLVLQKSIFLQEMERRAGIEPAALAWKARVLPLYERRKRINFILINNDGVTFLAKNVQIISLY